jgi:hypothetical protein
VLDIVKEKKVPTNKAVKRNPLNLLTLLILLTLLTLLTHEFQVSLKFC